MLSAAVQVPAPLGARVSPGFCLPRYIPSGPRLQSQPIERRRIAPGFPVIRWKFFEVTFAFCFQVSYVVNVNELHLYSAICIASEALLADHLYSAICIASEALLADHLYSAICIASKALLADNLYSAICIASEALLADHLYSAPSQGRLRQCRLGFEHDTLRRSTSLSRVTMSWLFIVRYDFSG